jgi:hypothetical protein
MFEECDLRPKVVILGGMSVPRREGAALVLGMTNKAMKPAKSFKDYYPLSASS